MALTWLDLIKIGSFQDFMIPKLAFLWGLKSQKNCFLILDHSTLHLYHIYASSLHQWGLVSYSRLSISCCFLITTSQILTLEICKIPTWHTLRRGLHRLESKVKGKPQLWCIKLRSGAKQCDQENPTMALCTIPRRSVATVVPIHMVPQHPRECLWMR